MANRPPKVAVLGARGVGRHHANWWRVEGAEVCAVLGRSPESAAAAAENLRDNLGISARAYADFEEMAKREQPEIYDICTPPETHLALARAALAAGGAVLCEKPLYFDARRSAAELRTECEALIEFTARCAGRLALCSQYAVAAEDMLALAGLPAPVRRFEALLCSPAAGRLPEPPRTWIDLGPHLIAALHTAAPGARLVAETLNARCEGHLAELEFQARTPAGDAVACRIAVTHSEGPPHHIRRLVLDGCAFEFGGEPGPDGHYAARYTFDGRSERRLDPMRVLIRDFLAGRDRVPAAAALENERALLTIWEKLVAITSAGPRRPLEPPPF